MKFLILIILLLPAFAQADYTFYYMKEGETYEDVAKLFGVDVSKIQNSEVYSGQYEHVRIDLSPVATTEKTKQVFEDGRIEQPTKSKISATSTDNTAELEAKIAQLQQLIQLLIQLMQLKNEQTI